MAPELLINKVKSLLQLEKEKRKEKKTRGELFNVFYAMRMEANEVYTHSAIIAEFLNPKGSHGSGDLYLKLFLQSVPELQKMEFDTISAKVDIEYPIGPINKDHTQGGRIDILVKSGDKAFIIENKIYAEDQDKQLYRYQQFAKEFSECYILYLTLDGKNASKGSLFEMSKEDYIKISYCSDINNWLTACINQSKNKPLVHETMIQYQNLIFKLTNQEMANSTKQGIIDLCNDADNVKTIFWLHQHFDSLMNGILNNVLQPKLAEVAERHKLTLIVKDNGKDWLNTKYMSFSFIRPEWRTFAITFMFQSKRVSDMQCGFRYIEKREAYTEGEITLYNKLAEKYEGKHTQRWPVCLECKGYSNWLNNKIISSIYDNGLVNKIEKDLLMLLQAEKEVSL